MNPDTLFQVKLWIGITLALLVVGFGVSTLASADHTSDAAQVVNAGCAPHGGIRTWGGSESYDATCEDGFAFVGQSEYWTPPWWAWWD